MTSLIDTKFYLPENNIFNNSYLQVQLDYLLTVTLGKDGGDVTDKVQSFINKVQSGSVHLQCAPCQYPALVPSQSSNTSIRYVSVLVSNHIVILNPAAICQPIQVLAMMPVSMIVLM